MIFQHSVKRCIYTSGIIAEVAEVFAYKRQLCFLRIHTLYTAYFFYCFCLKYIAADTVNSICRVYNNSAVKHALSKLLYKSGLGIIGMEVEEHVLYMWLCWNPDLGMGIDPEKLSIFPLSIIHY